MSAAGWDVVIVGGGPAGCAAAISARRLKLRALVLERHHPVQPPPCDGWLGPAAVRACRACGVDAARHGTRFKGLRLWPWDLSAATDVADPELAGLLVEPAALGQALLEAARRAGAEVRAPALVQDMQLREDGAHIRCAAGPPVSGSIVLIADGTPSSAAQCARVLPPRPGANGCCRAVLVGRSKRAGSGLELILGAGRTLRLATIARRHSEIRLTLLTGDTTRSPAEQLNTLVSTAQAKGVLPGDLQGAAVEAPCLGGAALELDSHVGKRCVLTGTAGGFVSAFSNDGLYPALRSGWLAAESAASALQAAVLQDELVCFSSRWRAELADYLRMPNTDLGLLLPMVFNNAQMSRRVARAFLLGQAL